MTGSGGPPGPAQFLKPIQDAIQRSTFNHQAWLSFWQQQMADGFKTLQAMAFCRSPAEAAELQASFVRESARRAKELMQGGGADTDLPPVTATAPPAAPAKAKPAPAPEPAAAPVPEPSEVAEAAKAVEASAADVEAQMTEAAPATGGDKADDLKQINGVGPAAEKTLKKLGITSFAQIAAFGPEDIERVEEHMRFKGRIERDDWVGQAKVLQGR